MKNAPLFILVLVIPSLLLAGCQGSSLQETAQAAPSVTLTLVKPIPTTTPSIKQPMGEPTSTSIPCDLDGEDYCLFQAAFSLRPPIDPPGTDTVDRGYPYGSTDGGLRDPHHGVEFYNGTGTPVLAAADGTVYYAGSDGDHQFGAGNGFYGNLVILQHVLEEPPFNTLFTLYAHLSKVDVFAGQAVKEGEKIGEAGMSGVAIGSHLHFEVRLDPQDYQSTLNPELWLRPHDGNGTLAIQVYDQLGMHAAATFNIQYYPDRLKEPAMAFELTTYAEETINKVDPWGEVACLGDQPAGWYRVSLIVDGHFYENWVRLSPSMLTLTRFRVN